MNNAMKAAIEKLSRSLTGRFAGISARERLDNAFNPGHINRVDHRILSACTNFMSAYIGQTAQFSTDDERYMDLKFTPETLISTVKGAIDCEVFEIIEEMNTLLHGAALNMSEFDIACHAKQIMYLLTVVKILCDVIEDREMDREFCIPAMFMDDTHEEALHEQ